MPSRVVFAVAALAGLPGCLTLNSDVRQITSNPEGALVRVEGIGECETPCSIKLSSTQEVTVAKAGYLAKRYRVPPGSKELHVELELAAPTQEIDSAELPALE